MIEHSQKYVVAALVALTFTASASAQIKENTGPNVNVIREMAGTLRLQTKSDKRHRGVEQWRIFVHRDGSRTMTMSKDFVAANALQLMTAHVAANFRPIDVYASYWTPDGYAGSIRVAVEGNELRAVSEGPGGRAEETLTVPNELAIVTHGESMNGWYLWQGERDDQGVHQATMFNLNPRPEGGTVVKGRLHPATFSYLGRETITVPAGTFETERYLISNIEMWISGEDRILIKQAIINEDKEYVLTNLEM